MDNYNNTLDNQTDNTNLLNALSTELNEIMSENELIAMKSSELCDKITACENRKEFINTSLTEAEKIAREITYNSERRVENIIARAQSIVESQREQITAIEREIAELSPKTNPIYFEENKPEPPIKDLNTQRKSSQFELEELSGENTPDMIKEEPNESNLLLLNENEYFLSDYREQNNPKDQLEIAEIDENEFFDFEADDLQGGEGIFEELRNLRETLNTRQPDKPGVSFKEKLGQIFKTGTDLIKTNDSRFK